MIDVKKARTLYRAGLRNRKKMDGSVWSRLEFYIESTVNDAQEDYVEVYCDRLGSIDEINKALKRLRKLGYECDIKEDYTKNLYVSITFM